MHKYTEKEEELITRVAREINPIIPKIFPKQRELLTLDYLLNLIMACECVLEEKGYHVVRVKGHNYRNKERAQILYAISFLTGEIAMAASRTGLCFKILNPAKKHNHIQIEECMKKRRIKASRPLAALEDKKTSHYICTDRENIILFSRHKKKRLNEYEFYVQDADKSKKMLEKYFGIC